MQEMIERGPKPVPFETPKRPFTDEYHEVVVVDDYR